MNNRTILLAAGDETGPWRPWHGGRAMFVVWGTFGGTTIRLEISPDGGTTALEIDANRTAAYVGAVEIPYGMLVRAKVTGGTSVSVNAELTAQPS